MGTLGQKLDYLTDTKSILKQKINNLGGSLTDESTFRSYGDYLDELYNEMPKVTAEGTEITLTPTRKGRMQLDLKGNTSQDSTTGKNLANLSILNQVPSTTNGELVTFGGGVCTELIEIDNTKDIVFSFSQTEGRQKYVMFYGENQNYLGYSIGMQTNWLLSENQNYSNSKYVRIRFDSKETTNWCQLEYNSTATDYEPYTGGQPSPNPDYPQPIHVVTGNNTISIGSTDYPINLGSIELCKIGDYQDYLYKENGNWYKYNANGKIVLNGTWSNTLVNTSSTNTTRMYLTNIQEYTAVSIKDAPQFSDKLICASINSVDAEGCYAGSNNTTVIRLNKSRVGTTKETFNQYLSQNNITIYYPLQEATSTQITDTTLISQLDSIYNAMSSNGSTTISQTNSDLPFIITASALKPFTTETLLTSLTSNE